MKKKRVFIICIILLMILSVFALDTRLKTVTYTIKTPEITKDIKLALVTDLHSCYYGENQSQLLEKIEKYNPDAVLLCGDIFDDVQDDSNANTFIDSIAKSTKHIM